MALIFLDSFDHYVTSTAENSDLAKKWNPYYPNMGTAAMSAGFSMGQDLTAPGGGNYVQVLTNTGGNSYLIWRQLPSSYATGIAGCWYMCTASGVNWTGQQPITLWDVSTTGVPTEQVGVRFDTMGRMTFCRNGTVLATSVNIMPPYVWMFIELKSTIHNTTGTYEVRVNGTSVDWIPAATGQNTRGSSNNSFNAIMFGGYTNATNWRIKGPYVCDSSGPAANDFLGPVRIATCHPMGVGASTAWIPQTGNNLGAINEKYGDSDTSFVASSVVNDVDTFDYEDVPTAGAVHGVQHVLYMRQDSGVKRQIAPVTKVSSTQYIGTTTDAASSYLWQTYCESVNPATSAQWTTADVNAAEFGYKLVT